MARLISVILLFSVCGVTAYIPHHYRFVNENKTWSEAQIYCRDKYTDLATINNMEEMKKLNKTLQFKSVTLAWIGLQRGNGGEFKWSLTDQTFYRDGDTYRNWYPGQPNNQGGKEFCVDIEKTGFWFDCGCDAKLTFVCYDENNTTINKYILINEPKTWYEAQTFCRENHTDLVSVRNQSENELIKNLIQTAVMNNAWIGLFYDSWKWSDQSKSSFRYWSSNEPIDDLNCAAVSESERHYWNNVNCTQTLPFICNEKYLILINQNLSWWEALNYCRDHHHDLFSVRSEEMQLWVKEVVQNASTEHVWLGLRHDCVQRIWFWVSGSMLCYQNWAPEEIKKKAFIQYDECRPCNRPWTEDCRKARRSGAVQSGGDQQWIELPESYKLNFICSTYDDMFY